MPAKPDTSSAKIHARRLARGRSEAVEETDEAKPKRRRLDGGVTGEPPAKKAESSATQLAATLGR